MTAPVRSKNHFTDLDGMRGLLAVVVMLHHFGLNTLINRFVPVGQAQWALCVDFFFVLSGFVLCRSVLARPTSTGMFAYRRFGRLFPMHLAILLLFFPILYGSSITPTKALVEGLALAPLGLGLLENAPAWSMSFEFYLPIVFVLLLGQLRQPPLLLVTIVGVILAMLMAALTYGIFAQNALGTSNIQEWCRAVVGLGLGFACWMVFGSRPLNISQTAANWLFMAVCAGFLLCVLLGTLLPALAVLVPLLITGSMLIGRESRSLFSWAPMQFLGRLSFGIYMVHWPVLHLFLSLYGEAGIKGDFVLKGAMVLLSFVLAVMLHYLVEMPGMRLFRRSPFTRAQAVPVNADRD